MLSLSWVDSCYNTFFFSIPFWNIHTICLTKCFTHSCISLKLTSWFVPPGFTHFFSCAFRLCHQHLCQFSTCSCIRLSQFHGLCLLVLAVIGHLIFSHVHLGLLGHQRHWQYTNTIELSTTKAHFTTLEYLVILLDRSVLWIKSFVLMYVYN